VLYQGTAEVATVTSGDDGRFLIEDLDNGIYDLVIQAPDYLETRVNVTVNDGYVKNMFNLSLTRGAVVSEVDVDNLVEFDMDDTGYGDSPTVLFGQNDVFNNMAGYNFSSVRYRVRGYSSESQDVYLAGVKMNDAITGYSPFSLWSGLNEATRTKYTVNGAEISDYGIGGYNGLTNLPVPLYMSPFLEITTTGRFTFSLSLPATIPSTPSCESFISTMTKSPLPSSSSRSSQPLS
jgi:hypothetical protein